MPCCGGLRIYPGQYKSPTGLEMEGCPIRLKEINNQKNPAPTRLVGAEVARGNSVRRRVGTMKAPTSCLGYKGEQCNPNLAYGPVFGFRQAPRFGSRCGNGGFRNIYSANHGDSSDVTKWRRLYGGSRQLFSTKQCRFGCCPANGNANGTLPSGRKVPLKQRLQWNKDCGGCLRYAVSGGVRKGDAVWKADGTTPNFFQVVGIDNNVVQVTGKGSAMASYMKHPGGSLSIWRRDALKQWRPAGLGRILAQAQCNLGQWGSPFGTTMNVKFTSSNNAYEWWCGFTFEAGGWGTYPKSPLFFGLPGGPTTKMSAVPKLGSLEPGSVDGLWACDATGADMLYQVAGIFIYLDWEGNLWFVLATCCGSKVEKDRRLPYVELNFPADHATAATPRDPPLLSPSTRRTAPTTPRRCGTHRRWRRRATSPARRRCCSRRTVPFDPVPVSGYFLPDGLFKQVRVLRSELRGVPAGRRPPAVRRRVVVLHVGGGQPGHAVWRADSCQYKGVLHAVPTAAGRDRKRGRRLAACVVPDPEPL